MSTYLEETRAVAKIGSIWPSAWVHDVIALLDTAVSQLDHQQAVHGTIVQAAALLRKQIDARVAKKNSNERGRLIGWQARKVRDYIDDHIGGRILVSDLCTFVRLSGAHFSRSFKLTFGESPHAFVIRRRLELAAEYMLQTEMHLSDIALRCGFSDQAHFSKLFRRASGLSPSVWRRGGGTQRLGRVLSQSGREQTGDASPNGGDTVAGPWAAATAEVYSISDRRVRMNAQFLVAR